MKRLVELSNYLKSKDLYKEAQVVKDLAKNVFQGLTSRPEPASSPKSRLPYSMRQSGPRVMSTFTGGGGLPTKEQGCFKYIEYLRMFKNLSDSDYAEMVNTYSGASADVDLECLLEFQNTIQYDARAEGIKPSEIKKLFRQRINEEKPWLNQHWKH